jgi:hypothetical protein
VKCKLTIAVFVCVLAAAAPALAQGEEILQPTPQQTSLRDLAFKAFGDGDMDTAIVMFERSLSIQELNTTWANLGRARFKNGDCAGAVQAFDEAASSPGDATKEEIGETLRRYRMQLPEACGQLLLSCKGEVEVQVDGGPRSVCSPQPVWVTVGTHEVVAHYDDGAVSRSVDVKGGFVREVILAPPAKVVEKVVAPVEPKPVEPKPVEPSEGSSTLAIVGWTSGGVGIAVLGTVVALDVTWTTPRYDRLRDNTDAARHPGLKTDFEDAQAINQTLFYTGAGFVALGAAFLLADFFSDEESDPQAISVTPLLTPNSVGIGVQF